jgi:2'-5' RNA ligase
MNAIVSLLDPTHEALVVDLWADLAREFGVQGISVTPIPHFSYQVAPHYDLDALEVTLRRFAQDCAPLRVCTAGLGVFTGAKPVLYVPVVRGPELSALQAHLSRAVAGLGSDALEYYEPARWVPHITLAQHDLYPENLPDVFRWLGERSFDWEIPVDNLAVIHDADARHQVRFRIPLGH